MLILRILPFMLLRALTLYSGCVHAEFRRGDQVVRVGGTGWLWKCPECEEKAKGGG